MEFSHRKTKGQFSITFLQFNARIFGAKYQGVHFYDTWHNQCVIKQTKPNYTFNDINH